MRPSRFLRAACILLTGALAATLWWGHLFLEHAREDATRDVGESNAEAERTMTVYDRPIPEGSVMQPWRIDDALALVRDGWLVFCGMSGELGDSEYDDHVVVLWMEGDGSYRMRDPDSGGNSQRVWTEDELREVDWKYFYGIRGGLYGAQRDRHQQLPAWA